MELLDKLNINPNDINLYEIAFNHTSYANENNLESYERLEFLGDAVLEPLMTEYLYNNIEAHEGEMTKLRAHYVCETALNEYSKKLQLNKYLKLGKGEEENGGRERKAILADVFEALLGAIYIDQGFEKTREFFNNHVVIHILNHEIDFFDDYKSLLQEYVQTDKKSLEYRLTNEKGPAHNKEFTVEVVVDGIVYGKGSGNSKKAAEQLAAEDALKKAEKGRF